jgi:hypothetical protein
MRLSTEDMYSVCPLLALFLGNDFVPYLYQAKNLVFIFNYDLSKGLWREHSLYRPRRLADITSFAVCMLLIIVLVIPIFIYCDCICLLFTEEIYGL